MWVALLMSAINSTHFWLVWSWNMSRSLIDSHIILQLIISLLLIGNSLLIFINHLHFQLAWFLTCRLRLVRWRFLRFQIAILIWGKMNSLVTLRWKIRSWELTRVVLFEFLILSSLIISNSLTRFHVFVLFHFIWRLAPAFRSAVVDSIIWFKCLFIQSLRELIRLWLLNLII